MSHLVLHLFGQPRLEQDGRPEEIKFRKSWALLAYLGAGETDATRDTLATLLWPESDQDHARASLRRALFELNQTPLGAWLVADRFTISLRPEARHHIDVVEFAQLLAGGDIGALQQAVALYQGDFLSGFYLSDSQPFEEWSTMQREGYRRQVLEALDTLTSHYLAQANYALAESAARRQLAIDDLRESAWRGLMEALVRDGRRNQALTEYRRCRQLLRDELGVVPATETTDLYEQIRLGELAIATPAAVPQSAIPVHRPAFLDDEAKPVQAPRAIFVARERELQQLDEFLRAALGGENRVVFVTGGPGRGKTALLGEFARQSIKAHPDLLVAAGHCNAYSGVGDPYLPFREVLGMLSGDVETLWAAGSVSREHARRLWQAAPLASRALLDHGPFLIDTLVPGLALLARVAAFAPDDGGRLDELQAWVEREKRGHIGLDQSALFAQVTNVLAALATEHPLLLLLDDLQWADKGSVGLLFHLGRRLENAPIMIVGAYRPEEITLIQDGELHRLQELVTEFKRLFGDTALDLTQADAVAGRQFVDRLLDTEPNRLSADFRTTLHRHTGGHPLFTAELLRAMQERGDLVQDKAGLWTESQDLDWRTLPARVGAVIEKRLQRLDPDLRNLLAVASVEGEHFTAQVVASVEGIPERQVLRALSMELGPAGHRLVWEAEEIQSGSRFLSRFRFAHALFQEYLYNGLAGGERRLLHGEVAAALEKVYQAQSYEIAARLAHHYTQAGQREKAIEYSLLAGDQARRAFANEEAVAHYERVLAWIAPSVPPAGGEDRSPFIPLPSNGKDAEAERAWWLEALTGLGKVQYFVGQLEDAETCFRDALALAEHTKLVPSQVVQLRWWLGEVLFWRGRLDEVVRNAEAGLALLSQEDESAEAALMVSHLVAVFMQQQELQKSRIFAERLASFLQQLPYSEVLKSAYILVAQFFVAQDLNPDKAGQWIQALRERAVIQQDLRALAEVSYNLAGLRRDAGDGRGAIAHGQEALDLCRKIGDAKFECWSLWALAHSFLRLGELQKAEMYALQALETARRIESQFSLGLAHARLGEIYSAFSLLDKAEHALQTALQLWREIGNLPRVLWLLVRLGRLYLAMAKLERAFESFKEAIALAGTDGLRQDPLLHASILSGLEEAYRDPTAFRAFCQRLREENRGAGGSGLLIWYLEAAQPETFAGKLTHVGFEQLRTTRGTQAADCAPSNDWVWHDPFEDCSFRVGDGLEIRATNARGLGHINFSAPRLLRPASEGDFAVQTLCRPALADRPAIGGLLLWLDERNYLRLDRGTQGEREISLQGRVDGDDLVLGRGRLNVWESRDTPAPADTGAGVWLRMEWVGGRISALCSADGDQWFSVGSATFPTRGHLRVGLHAVGDIDRNVYRGAYCDGTAIRFESFTLRSADR